jgi:hypothetical protein
MTRIRFGTFLAPHHPVGEHPAVAKSRNGADEGTDTSPLTHRKQNESPTLDAGRPLQSFSLAPPTNVNSGGSTGEEQVVTTPCPRHRRCSPSASSDQPSHIGQDGPATVYSSIAA